MNVVERIHNENLRDDLPEIRVGDSVRMNMRIVEGGKERVQAFTGTVIADEGGGKSRKLTVRRVAFGNGIERIVPVESPRLASVDVLRKGQVRRSKLYYLRKTIGKASRVKEKKQG